MDKHVCSLYKFVFIITKYFVHNCIKRKQYYIYALVCTFDAIDFS
jgi:hypothetical protein